MSELPEVTWKSLVGHVAQQRINMFCKHCGSDDVTRDAVVRWNVEEQVWEVSNIFDNADCHVCGGETKLEEKAI